MKKIFLIFLRRNNIGPNQTLIKTGFCGEDKRKRGGGRDEELASFHPMLDQGLSPHPQKLLRLSWKEQYQLCEGPSSPSHSLLNRQGLQDPDVDEFLHLLE